jgi:TRAP-type C4-dicarboxylate transport system permease small subunit
MFGCFRILAAIPGFFISALIMMLLWGVFAPQVGLKTINYAQAMLVTITIWLVVAPLFAVGSRQEWFIRRWQ